MAYLSSLRLKNFRGFLDTCEVPLTSINVLVGRNSIGKSSFARVWPLLRQSVNVKKSAPVLWLGDLVDMGSFDEVASIYSNDRLIEFSFTIKPDRKNPQKIPRGLLGLIGMRRIGDSEIIVDIQLAKSVTDSSSYARKVKIQSGGNFIEVVIDEHSLVDEIIVNNKKYLTDKDFYSLVSYSSGIIPKIIFFEKIAGKSGQKDKFVEIGNGFNGELIKKIRKILHKNTAEYKVLDLASKLPFFGTPKEVLEWVKDSSYYSTDTWKDYVQRLSEKTKASNDFDNLQEIIILSSIGDTFDYVSSMLSEHFSRVRYIEPIRATAERFYRHQELAVDEIDSKGSNLVFFIKSLKEDVSNLNGWLQKHLNIEVFAEERSGHLSLIVHDLNTDRRNNIADMGFGFSQIIPIAVQIWTSINRKRKESSFTSEFFSETIVIEQPELHLHPAMQAKIAEMIVGIISAAKESNLKLNFVIETHSQHFISRLGDLVARLKITPSDVNILMFEQTELQDTKISMSQFDSDGNIKNWPYGFFEADE